MSEIQEYYSSSTGYVTIWGEVKGKPEMVIVSNGSDYGELTVVARSQLEKKEDSWTYKEAERRADELRTITAKAEENFEKVVEKVIKTACSTLSTRMKMNVVFGKDISDGGWAIVIADELNKLVRKEAKDVVKDKADIL